MFYDFTVKIPVVPGRIILKKNGDATYVLYEISRTYNPEKRYNVPRRVVIGKVAASDTALMHPNEKFNGYFPKTALPEERPEAYRSCCLRIGTYIVIRKVMQELKLIPIIGKRMGKDSGLFMDLMAYLIVDECNAGQYYPDFAFCHPLFSEGMRIHSDWKVSKFLHSLTKEQIIGFLDDWNDLKDHKQRVYVYYDSTNRNCQAGDMDIVEFGKAKEDRGLPVFNSSIVFDKTNRTPLFYEEYPGSINDVSQFPYMVQKTMSYGYKHVGFILDRGYFSKENIDYMDGNNYHFIIMVKGCKKLVSALVMSRLHTFETDRSCAIRPYNVYGTTCNGRLYANDTKDRCFHIYFNSARMAAERSQLEARIDRLKDCLKKCEGQKVAFTSTYSNYFTLNYNGDGVFLFAEERQDTIQNELDLCGYFCIITTERMTAEQALILYKGRDVSEKLFCSEKTFIGSTSMRVQSGESLSAKVFLEFVTLIVRNRIYNCLKETMIRIERKRNYLTVPAAVKELEKIEMVRRNNEFYRLDHAVTNTQKVILSSFGLSAENVIGQATEIGNLLRSGSSIKDAKEETEEGGNNGTFEDDCIC